jgi:hypothetical protein
MAVPHGLHQPQRELMIRTGVARDEVADMLGDSNAFDIAAGLNFEGDIFCDILRPMLKRIEGDNAERVVELSRHQIGDDGFEVGLLDFGLAVDGAKSGKAVDHEVDRLIRTVGYDPRRPADARHTHLPPQQGTGNLSTKLAMVPAQKKGPGTAALRGLTGKEEYIRPHGKGGEGAGFRLRKR